MEHSRSSRSRKKRLWVIGSAAVVTATACAVLASTGNDFWSSAQASGNVAEAARKAEGDPGGHEGEYRDPKEEHGYGDSKEDHGYREDAKEEHGGDAKDDHGYGDGKEEHGDAREEHGDGKGEHGDAKEEHGYGDSGKGHGYREDSKEEHDGDAKKDHDAKKEHEDKKDHDGGYRDAKEEHDGDAKEEHGYRDHKKDHEYGDHKKDHGYRDHKKDHGYRDHKYGYTDIATVIKGDNKYIGVVDKGGVYFYDPEADQWYDLDLPHEYGKPVSISLAKYGKKIHITVLTDDGTVVQKAGYLKPYFKSCGSWDPQPIIPEDAPEPPVE